MIAQFRFVSSPGSDTIAIRMLWLGGQPMATIHLPESVLRMAEGSDMPVLSNSEPLKLPVLLGYGVTIAALTGHVLRLTGDQSAWREEWGALQVVN